MKRKDLLEDIRDGLYSIKESLDDINPLDERKKTKTYRKLELSLLFLYTFATIAIAIVAVIKLPEIAETLKSPEIIVRINPYVENDYVPIEILNIGKSPANNLNVRISSCYMEDFIPYDVGTLYPGKEYKIQFKHKKTIEGFKKIDCQSFSDFNFSNKVEIMTYKDKRTGKILVPPIKKTLDVCGYCFWDINITMEQGEKILRESIYSPIQMEFSMPGNIFDKSDPNIVQYSPIYVSLYDQETIEKLEGQLS